MVPSEKIDPETFFAKGSVYSEKEPLCILNGKIYEGKITELDPKTIEAIHVLKDANSTALYGEKGKNGVILITTKKEQRIPTEKSPKN